MGYGPQSGPSLRRRECREEGPPGPTYLLRQIGVAVGRFGGRCPLAVVHSLHNAYVEDGRQVLGDAEELRQLVFWNGL